MFRAIIWHYVILLHMTCRLRLIRSHCRDHSDLYQQRNLLKALCKVFIRPVARVGSGDPVRVIRLYTTNTPDEVCSIYCWDICTTCRYRSTCYSTGASGPTALSVCSRLCLVANCSLSSDWLTVCWLTRSLVRSRTVLYGAFYSYLCRRYWNGILGPSSPLLPGESFDTCSKAVAFTLADTQVF